MELLQIRYFASIAKTGNLTKTAAAFYVTPSAVSSSIKRLEEELGVLLFDRSGRSMILNQYGNVFLKHMSTALDAIENAGNEIADMKGIQQSRITFCATNAMLWEDAIINFHRNYPGISVRQIPFDTGITRSREIDTEIDFVVASADTIDDPNMEHIVLFKNPLYLAVPKSHRLAARNTIDLAEAKNEFFINSLTDTAFRKYCDGVCRQAGFTPKSKLECDYQLRPKILEHENMVCITTLHGCLSGIFDECKVMRIVKPVCFRTQALFWHKDRYQGQHLKAFKAFFIDYYSGYDKKYELF